MRVLIIKTSSMGDVIHALPALTDASSQFPDIQFDWVVEESFAEIPAWHPSVKKIIPIAFRRWRKNLFAKQTYQEWNNFRKQLRATSYDLIIDAQGLMKSAWLGFVAKGPRCGLDWQSAREPFASLMYTHKCTAGKIKEVHAVTRMRRLFSEALHYSLPDTVADYGLNREKFVSFALHPYVVFLHGTTWDTKHWPEEYWIALAKKMSQHNIAVKLSWGNQQEQERALRLAAASSNVEVLPRMKLAEFAKVLAAAKAIVAVDTGLGHLAAALDVPTVSLYGPTNPVLTGALGRSQIHLSVDFHCAPCLSANCLYPASDSPLNPTVPPCFSTLTPERVWRALSELL